MRKVPNLWTLALDNATEISELCLTWPNQSNPLQLNTSCKSIDLRVMTCVSPCTGSTHHLEALIWMLQDKLEVLVQQLMLRLQHQVILLLML